MLPRSRVIAINRSKTFDHTGSIFVTFDKFVGPPKVIHYVWANHRTNTALDHPLSSRQVHHHPHRQPRSGPVVERISLAQRGLGAIVPGRKKMPKIVGIGVFTNSEGSEAPVQACSEDIPLFTP